MEPTGNKFSLLGARPKVRNANNSGRNETSTDIAPSLESKARCESKPGFKKKKKKFNYVPAQNLVHPHCRVALAKPSKITNYFEQITAAESNEPNSHGTDDQNGDWNKVNIKKPKKYIPGPSNDCNRENSGYNSRKKGPFKNGIDYTMRYRDLTYLIQKRNNEILLTLVTPKSGFFKLLEHTNSRNCTVMPYILIAIGKAITSSYSSNVASLLNSIQTNQTFLFCSIPSYLVGFGSFAIEPCHLQSLSSLLDFLDFFQKSCPATAFEACSLLVVQLKIACQLVSANQDVDEIHVLMNRIQVLEANKKRFGQGKDMREIKKESRMEQLNLKQPPEDFRDIPVAPQLRDIKDCNPFIRPNLKKGRYVDVDHYLDVQYRLLREDYIRPLREGIAIYSEQKKAEKSEGRKKQSCKVYENVNVTGYEFTFQGILHTAHFEIEKFKRVNWETTKRFMSGSLLCLTQDDFETFLIATVAKRKPEDLSKGVLSLQFPEITSSVLQIKPEEKYTVMETDAFFEAFRHTLSALSLMETETFPLKEYLVEMNMEVKPPHYLRQEGNSVYDMTCLSLEMQRILKLNSSRDVIEDSQWPTSSELGLDELQYRALKYAAIKPYHKRQEGNSVYDMTCLSLEMQSILKPKYSRDVLEDSQWPTSAELGLDESQYRALKSAVTKELTIIQGPPGTGKTYVGLRIVQLILSNMKSFSDGPIIVACYTNHALDQFLEGMLPFTESIVRIGGRCKNEMLDPYTLFSMRSRIGRIGYLWDCKANQKDVLEELVKRLQDLKQIIEESYDNIIREETLKWVMRNKHYHTLINFNPSDVSQLGHISQFLEIKMTDNVRREIQIQNEPNTRNIVKEVNVPGTRFTREVLDEYSADEEGDLEYLEDMRAVDHQEYQPMFTNKFPHPDKSIKIDVTLHLKNCNAMTERDVCRVKNVWGLDLPNRWRLYKYWVNQYIIQKEEEIIKVEQKLHEEYEKYKEMQNESDLTVLQGADIVGMTTTGAAKYKSIVQQLKSKIVVVEEAAEILEAHVITSLTKDTEHLILIGDHQQLRPNPMVYELAVKYNLNVSLFERMINNGMGYHQLTIQHRMRPCIASLLVPHIYPSLINHESVLNFEDIKGVTKNMFYVTHNVLEMDVFDSSSRKNEYEAEFLVRLCEYLLLQGYKESQITILTTYSGQLFLLKRIAKNRIDGVRITVVDNFQGEENDIILISFVRSNLEKRIGFLKTPNRVCVALSRAKKGLYCIGNFQLFAEQCKLWKNIVQSLEKEEAVGPTLTLVCQIHKNETKVTIPTDFDKVPSGGCGELCEFRLQCGHACVEHCHAYDPFHEEMECLKPCARTCSAGHKCPKKCYKDCGNCEVIVSKLLPKCQHTVPVACYIPADQYICRLPCERRFPCEHPCPNICGTDCGKCMVILQKLLPKCQHTVPVPCHFPAEEFLCPLPCEREFSCGHPCVKKCYKDCGKCMVAVQKLLPKCQHTLPVPCHLPAEEFSCPLPCERKFPCEHPCVKKCHEECGKCMVAVQKLLPKCQHTLDVPCSVPAGQFSCTLPCERTLLCGHKCGSLCGRDCSDYECKIRVPTILKCSHEMTLLCYQTENKDGCLCDCKQPCAVKLPNCSHACRGICGNCFKRKWHDEKKEKFNYMRFARYRFYENKYVCNKPCEKKLSCGHNCMLECGESCSSVGCNHEVKVTFKCGHYMAVKCPLSKDADLNYCRNPCGVKMSCGHICYGICEDCHLTKRHEDGNKAEASLCKFPVTKTLPKCKHKVSVPCNETGENYQCQKPCRKKLTCRHECELLCFEDCSKFECKKIVSANLRCSHSATMACYQSSNSDIYLSSCRNPCRAKLKCGHTCSGTCSLCYQGRFHQDCFKKCTKTLICGHACESTCLEPCPPCRRPCKNQCPHKKCLHECYLPCKKCEKLCQWACAHTLCTSKCGDLCDREVCNEPCSKKLRCKHRCMGVCGEPCPQICWYCDPKKVERLFKFKGENDEARFVQLNECKHIFNIEKIEQCIKTANEHEIAMILCPACGTPIRRDIRFQSVVKPRLLQVEKVKRRVLQLELNNVKKTVELRARAKDLNIKDLDNLLFILTSRLEREKLSYSQLVQFENAVNMAEELFNFFPSYYGKFVFEFYFEFGSKSVLPGSIVKHMKRLKVLTMQNYEMITNFIRYQYDKRSEEAVENISLELQRFKHQCKLLDFLSKKQYSKNFSSHFETPAVEEVSAKLVDTLCQLKPFSCSNETEFMELFQRFSALLGTTAAYAPGPKKDLLKRMTMSVGYWNSFPNGLIRYNGTNDMPSKD